MQGAGEEARGGHRRGDVGSLQPRSLGTLGMPESAGAAEAHRHDGLVWGMSSCGAGEGHEGSAGVVLVLSGCRKTERGLGILSVAQAATKRALKCPSPGAEGQEGPRLGLAGLCSYTSSPGIVSEPHLVPCSCFFSEVMLTTPNVLGTCCSRGARGAEGQQHPLRTNHVKVTFSSG